MVSPVGCWGKPHDACRKMGIPVIRVQENTTWYHRADIVFRDEAESSDIVAANCFPDISLGRD